MPTKTKKQAKGKGKATDLVITRVYNAAREKVWKAWTEPERVKRWFGPKGYTIPSCEIDLRVGGKIVYCMRSPDGKDFWARGDYRQIVPMEKLVWKDNFADEHGEVVSATHYGMSEDYPMEMLVTVTFEDVGGKTKMTLRHAGLPAGPGRSGAGQGWSESFEKLAASLAEESSGTSFVINRRARQVIMSGVFDAPRDRVFKAYTDPKLIPKWWGLRSQTTTVERMDVRKGGRWRYVCRDADGNEYAFRGEYREIVPPERLVATFEFEGTPGHIVLETAIFEDLKGKTKLTAVSQYKSVEDLDEMVKAGMEFGARETWDRLKELLAGA